MNAKKLIATLVVLFINYHLVQAQMEPPPAVDTAKHPVPLMQMGDTIYQNEASGELTPGKGFLIAKNQFASLNISIYGMARYLN